MTRLALLLLLAGCNSLPIDYAKMSAEQIREVVRDKSITVQCSRINTPYGPGIMTIVGMDKGMPQNATVTVNGECQITTETGK